LGARHFGARVLRVEDPALLTGRARFVDDVKLPGMLHGDFVRSPHAHARVKSINSEEALKVPGVLAVITAETLKTVNLAWMPTLAGDVQMVLADGKVLYQNQEVAFVIAETIAAAKDAVERIIVDYDVLPAITEAIAALAPNAIRRAISRARPAARATSRLATFALAISRILATAPVRTMAAVRTSRTIYSWSGMIRNATSSP